MIAPLKLCGLEALGPGDGPPGGPPGGGGGPPGGPPGGGGGPPGGPPIGGGPGIAPGAAGAVDARSRGRRGRSVGGVAADRSPPGPTGARAAGGPATVCGEPEPARAGRARPGDPAVRPGRTLTRARQQNLGGEGGIRYRGTRASHRLAWSRSRVTASGRASHPRAWKLMPGREVPSVGLDSRTLAERAGFEPAVGFTLRPLSKRVPSASRSPLR